MGFPPVKRYAHLFFDLDHTLWDFTTNSRTTLAELHSHHRLADRGIQDTEAFVAAYERINALLWAELSKGRIPKEVLRVLRFRRVLQHFGVADGRLAAAMSADYLAHCPLKPGLMPGARELLAELEGRYRLHIITNGFEEVQRVKLASSGIAAHFDVVITSERAGAPKPHPRIFQEALHRSGAAADNCLMIGDSADADMAGARCAGWDHVHFHAEAEPDPGATYRVAHLSDLLPILG